MKKFHISTHFCWICVCVLLPSPCPFSTSAFWDVSRSYTTTSPPLNDATMWAGSQPLKSTDVGTPCSTNTHTDISLTCCCSCCVLRGAVSVLTLVCVESADAGVLLRGVPQFDRSICRAGQEAVLDATVSQSPNSVCMPRPWPCQDTGI